ncbi:NAD(P)-dependent oxidoreductase [Pseudomonas sp. SLFW]|uniref:NAD-dependent epimerase/dehydratase family protein n=1 Tax=Pseudomonas sp. SLFW TaxID=2683259 RepID=UPI0014120E8B|nr:NAD(P)-dependent oxidoreductase [Pseudomonas sp. SLFW]NBB09857.1 NAD-dependent epimerase/dehydratase family protein [Pseudomonas sp. SLFW]
MSKNIFLAGATGVIGSTLVKLLVDDGYTVFGSTRREDRADYLRALGAEPVVVDVFDREKLCDALIQIKPSAVVHQLTDLPRGLDPAQMAAAIARNARVRTEGTGNLIAAMLESGCESIVAQSIAWAYAPATKPYEEDAELDINAEGLRQVSVGGIVALEQQVLHTPQIHGAVLRYGHLYGPGTGTDQPSGASPLHVVAAAYAALLALRLNVRGVFNVAEENAEVTSEKARRVLGWVPELRLSHALSVQ